MKFSEDKKGYNKSEVDAYLKRLAEDYNRVVDAQREHTAGLKRALSDAEGKLKAYKEKTGQITKAILSAVSKADEIEKLARLRYEHEIARLKAFHEKWIWYYDRMLEKYPINDDLTEAGDFNRRVKKTLASVTDTSQIPEELERTYESERRRLEAKQAGKTDKAAKPRAEKETAQKIGYITVRTSGAEYEDDDALLDMIPDADLSSPILHGDSVERIKRYLNNERVKTPAPAPKKKKSDETASAKSKPDYSDRAPSGFSFEEALNPKDDLAQIMRDLGLLLEDN